MHMQYSVTCGVREWLQSDLHCHGCLELLLRHCQPCACLVVVERETDMTPPAMLVNDAKDVGKPNSGVCESGAAVPGLTRECATSSAMCGALTKAMRQNGHSTAAAAQIVGACSVCALVMRLD